MLGQTRRDLQGIRLHIAPTSRSSFVSESRLCCGEIQLSTRHDRRHVVYHLSEQLSDDTSFPHNYQSLMQSSRSGLTQLWAESILQIVHERAL